MKKKVFCLLNGGLGNQLFQYSFSKKISESLKAELILDVSKLNFDPLRKLEILQLGVTGKVLYRAKVFSFILIFFEKFLRFFNLSLPYAQFIFEEKEFYFQPPYLDSSKKYFFISGYWQSYKYFDYFSLNLNINTLNFSIYSNSFFALINSSNSVSIHVRRSDYLISKNSKMYDCLPSDYYQKAILHLNNIIINPFFFIFSDDISWCKNSFNGSNFHFVDNSNHTNSTLIDFLLMVSCKHNIIANSTFSWWAASLNSNSNKVVIAPQVWIMRDHNIDDIFPPDWIII